MRASSLLLLSVGLGLAPIGTQALAQDGACCLGDSMCIDTNSAGCDLGSGDFLGEKTKCATTTCTGACCLENKACDQNSRDGCGTAGGTFQGPGSMCALHCAGKLSTAFSYQGQLKQAGAPLNGAADLEFSLWTTGTGGDQVGETLFLENVPVAGGLLSVPLDFGVNVFNGNARWLEIAVRSPHDPGDTVLFTTLAPRQLISATPYALQTRGLFVDDAGNVGIGTTSPGRPLHISRPGTNAIVIEGSGTGNVASKILMVTGDQRWDLWNDGIALWGSDNSFHIIDVTANKARFTIDTSGNVGIGTTTPGNALHISRPGTNGAIIIEGSGTGNVASRIVMLTGDQRWDLWNDGVALWGNDNSFHIIDATANKARFTIDTSGNVGIGTTTPGNALHISRPGTNGAIIIEGSGTGNVASRIVMLTGDRRWDLWNDGVALWGNDNSFHIIDATANRSRFTIDTSGNVGIGRTPTGDRLSVEGNASKTTAGSWLANSDRRIKKNIRAIHGALDKLDKVRLVSFEYTDDYRAKHAGLDDRRYLNVIAQEFAEVFPDHVQTSGEQLPDGSEILQVDTYPLTIYAAAAIQELHGQMQAKEAEIDALRDKNAELETRLTRIEAILRVKSSQVNGGAR